MIDVQFPLNRVSILVVWQTETGDIRCEVIPAGQSWVSDQQAARLLAPFERKYKQAKRKKVL